jgi:hypothetical protein
MDIAESILKWLKQYGLLVNAATGFLGIITYSFQTPPPLTLGQDNSLDFLTKALVIIILIFGFFLTLILNKFYHYKIWFLVSVICLIGCFGYFLFNPQKAWVCDYKDGRRYVMGYNLTPDGYKQTLKPICQRCEELISDCGSDDPENIWTSESIAWVSRFLFIAYFSIFPFVVFFIIGVVQVLACLSPPNPRIEVKGTWYGQVPNKPTKVKLVITESNGRKITGFLNYEYFNDEGLSNNLSKEDILKSSFWFENLYFSAKGRTDKKKYRMVISSVLQNKATFEHFIDEQKRYVFYCELNKDAILVTNVSK